VSPLARATPNQFWLNSSFGFKKLKDFKQGEKDVMETIFSTLYRCLRATRFIPIPVLLLSLAVAVWALTAPTTIFEIDGDSVAGSTYGVNNLINCDWDILNANKTANSTTPSGTCSAGGATFGAYGFIVGNPGEPNFSGGGSKDPLDISQWAFTTTSTPDKDTLTHGYAASYTGSAGQGGDNLLVFGGERFAVNGDSNIGIWFFQQNISIPAGASKGTFSGVHVKGDILVISAFTGGGGTSTISVYQWRPDLCKASHYTAPTSGQTNVCADTNLFALFVDLTVGTGGTCSSSTPACAVVNNKQITIGWPYQAKFGITNSNNVPTGGFYEGGIDLTNLLGGAAAPCFASFLLETRSSQSTSAVLKDFLVGSFPECHMSISKTYTCNSFNANGSFNYSYQGTVTNDGGGGLFNVQAKDNGVSYQCGNLAKGTSKNFPSLDCPQPSGTTATKTTTTHPDTNVADATADTSADGSTPPISGSTGAVTSSDASGTSCTPNPSIDVTKRCVTGFQASGSQIAVRVDYTGEVINTGQLNLTSVNVKDDADTASYGPFTLNVGESRCYTNGQLVSPGPPPTGCPSLAVTTGTTTSGPTGSASYFPGSAGNPFGLTLGRLQFTDTVTATGTASNGTSVGPTTKSASCVICPFGSCPTN
jgi:hypothetical protein